MSDLVRLKRMGPLQQVTLDRPARKNALTVRMWQALEETLRQAADQGIRALVLTGAGGSFCSGNDIEALGSTLADPASARTFHGMVERVLDALEKLPLPTIAALDGACFGAGLMLATACDLRVASPTARFCAPPAKLGLVYGISETNSLVRLIGAARAKDLLFTGRVVSAKEACALGLIERLTEGTALDAALALAQEIIALSPSSHRASKRLASAAAAREPRAPWMDQLRDEAAATADFREGRAAFLAKRPPRFS